MAKLLVCVDGSSYADKICFNAAWAAKRLNASIEVLHVLRRRSEYDAPASDHTGAIGLESRSDLMEELARVDEERGRLDQQKGRLILAHGEKILRNAGVNNVSTIYRRGSLSDTIKEIEADYDIIFVGKRGEQANVQSEYLGSNLEKVARLVTKPLFAVSSVVKPIKRFLIAYDGKESARKAIEFASRSPLLQGLECHLLTVDGQATDSDLQSAEQTLKAAGYKAIVKNEVGKTVHEAIGTYVSDQEINLLLTGAYGHSRLRAMFLGSTTARLIKSCDVPLLLFR